MGDEAVDLNCIARRHSLLDMTHEDNCITILYGSNLAENRRLCLVAPCRTASVWFRSLRRLQVAASKVQQQTDRRTLWLKQQYLLLYYDSEKCTGPTPAEAIKVRLSCVWLCWWWWWWSSSSWRGGVGELLIVVWWWWCAADGGRGVGADGVCVLVLVLVAWWWWCAADGSGCVLMVMVMVC